MNCHAQFFNSLFQENKKTHLFADLSPSCEWLYNTFIQQIVTTKYGDIFHHKNVFCSTLQPLYNTVHYNMDLDITRFKDGSQKCIDYIEK